MKNINYILKYCTIIILAIPDVTSMWFRNKFLQCGSNSWDILVGKALDSKLRGWCKAWVRIPVGASAVEEADLPDRG